MYRLVKGNNPEEVSRELAEFIKRIVEERLRSEGLAKLGLAGGRTPKLTYRLLSQTLKDWDRILIFPTDERFVPPEDPRSNFRMLRETLGERAKIYRVKTELPLEKACRDFESALSETGSLDFILLGMGADGHTASLFPGVPCRLCGENACTSKSPDGLERISMSLSYINSASEIAFLVLGEEKRQALEKLLEGADIPAGRVRKDAIVFTDLDI